MTELYPLPSYGLSIWLTGDTLNIAIPPAADGTRQHTICLPLAKCSIETTEGGSILGRQRGWLVLLELLKSKEREKRNPNAKIGNASAPVKYDIEQMLVGMKKFDTKGNQKVSYEDLDFNDQ